MTAPAAPSASEHSHTPDGIRARLDCGPSHGYLRDFVYGAIDGAVTTFAVVSGVAGAGLAPNVVIILGVANLVGDGFSMAAGNYLGTKAEVEQRQRTRLMEEHHISQFPEGEREEIRQIYAAYGFDGELLEEIVRVITSNRDRWIDTMLREEHGLAAQTPNPWRAAISTFIAFLVVGSVPLLPFLLNLLIPVPVPYLLSTLFTFVAFFLVGTAKARFVSQHWAWAGFETLIVGGAASGLAYLCGLLLKSVA